MAVKASASITLTRVNDGAAGVGIKSVDVEYYLSTSSTSQAGGSWSTTAPTWVDGKYIWTRTKTVTTDNKTTTTSPVCITGGKGSTGSVGQGVQSITEEYYLSTSKTTQTGGSWVTTPPTWSKGKYMWTRSKIVYKNPTSTAYTTPVCDSSWEAVNGIEIGGRNLMQNTSDFISTLYWGDNGSGTKPTIENNYIKGKKSIKHEFTNLEPDTEYVCVATIKSDCPDLIPSANRPLHNHVLCDENSLLDNYVYAHCDFYNGDSYAPNKFTTYILTFKTKPNITNVRFRFMVYHASLNSVENENKNTIWLKSIKLEKGNVATDYTKAPEDLEKRVADAEQKIEPGKITATVEDQINKNGSTVLATKSYVTQESDKVLYKFSSSGGTNLIKGSKVEQTSNVYGFANRSVDMGILRKGKTYTLTINGRTVNGAGGRYLTVFIFNGDWTFFKSITIKETVDTTRSITFTVPSNLTGNLMVSSYHYPEAGDRSGSSRINWYCLTEGEVSSLWLPHHGELIDGSTQIDGNGVTILNGAITIKNKSGQTVLQGDVDGNLSLTGSLVVSSNKNQILRVDTADTKFPHLVIDAYGPYMDRLSVCSDYAGYVAQKAVDGVFIRNNKMEIYGTGETFWNQGDARVSGLVKARGFLPSTSNGAAGHGTGNIGSTGWRFEGVYAKYFDSNGNVQTPSLLIKDGGGGIYFDTPGDVARIWASKNGTATDMAFETSDDGDQDGFVFQNRHWNDGVVTIAELRRSNIWLKRDVRMDRLRGGANGGDNFYVGAGNFRIEATSNGHTRLYTSPVGATDTGMYMDPGGYWGFKLNSVYKHQFQGNGTKIGGSIEIEGITYGMSPIDSPRSMIEDIYFDYQLTSGDNIVEINDILAKSLDKYAIFTSNHLVEVVEKSKYYFVVRAEKDCISDIRITGIRIDVKDQYYELMGGIIHGTEERVDY